ncbi:hypothetical protein Syun_019486 [Stephania yunnanensis]|uniref:cellulase n=1 Tax=Stephania yunnanensis TaxID=152371 RepID=A0AAP0NXH1_9MAGN
MCGVICVFGQVDLVGGYYDAGDNVKFGLPMAFTITMMSWSIVEYGKQMAANGELGHAMEAVKWGTDYLIKAHPQPYVPYGEDMTTDRRVYRIDTKQPWLWTSPGETAAAMAAASIVFRRYNPAYSNELLSHAKQDELLRSAAWMYQATNDQYYLDYFKNNGDALGGTGWAMTESAGMSSMLEPKFLLPRVQLWYLSRIYLEDILFDLFSPKKQWKLIIVSTIEKVYQKPEKREGDREEKHETRRSDGECGRAKDPVCDDLPLTLQHWRDVDGKAYRVMRCIAAFARKRVIWQTFMINARPVRRQRS